MPRIHNSARQILKTTTVFAKFRYRVTMESCQRHLHQG